MSKRKNPRRAATLLMRHFPPESDSNSDDEDEMGLTLIHLMQEALFRSRRSAHTPKRRRSSKSSNRKTPAATSRAQKNKTSNNTSSTSIINLDSDSNQNENVISDEVKKSYQKNVENKVDNFFKSNNLLSDDEDEIVPRDTQAKPVTASKDFYEIPDSDDDIPSTSVKDVSIEPKVIEEKIEEIPSSHTKDEELMLIVDTILDNDDTPEEVNPSAIVSDNWNEFKTKTDEIIGSVTAYLETLKSDEKPESNLPPKEISPVKTKPTCPICLEVINGDTVPGATTCGHIFCMQCIQQVAKTSKKCPTCRKRVTLKQIHPLYL